MHTRRDFLASTALSATAIALMPLAACSQETTPAANPTATPLAATADTPFSGTLIKRTIPSSGEQVPAIGMGTSGSFEVGSAVAERDPLREVLKRFVAAGASVIDTAPTYGSAEDVLGDLLAEAKARDRIFLATKLSGVSGRDEGLTQFNDSLRRLRTDKVELLQVHNLRDTATQFELARELKQQGKVKYTGLTHYVERAHEELADAMQKFKPDFVQINYSPVSRGAEQRIFPLAKELGIAVMINRAFEDGDLFGRVKGKPVPDWAKDVGADSWAQLFLKFVLSQPEVTVVIPATSKPKNQTDNLKAGVGGVLDEKQRAALIAALG
ncbi:aryl-alcohol dehydrogenase-like predicted oxidoreductase [Luteimonas cucumeris]|uniref:Aryl-alcohol dehydrogenase-like predicted oxidoreductase n=1 Tax=Luteimonas cucumeris TaxID=985012 RepID=A0A562L046_9GAMM|nr:aldo/keto reductase [Luteimonas cucumeris]TWI01015.1 aryl-alcohol dehydrogenase-like predicted oxidoreductase [Luteimonas cucumeris]